MRQWRASVVSALKRHTPIVITYLERAFWAFVLFIFGGFAIRLYKHYRLHKIRIPVDLVLVSSLFIVLAAAIESYEERIESDVSADLVRQIDSFTHGRFKRKLSRVVAEDNNDGIDGSRVFMKPGGPTWLRKIGIKAVLFEAFKAGLPNEDIAVILATVHQESGYNPLAEAVGTTACGLSQFITETGDRYGLKVIDCLDPNKNAQTLTRYYSKMMRPNRYGNRVTGSNPKERLESMMTVYYCAHHDGENHKDCKESTKEKAVANFDVLHASLVALNEASVERNAVQSFALKVKHVAERRIINPVLDAIQYIGDWASNVIVNMWANLEWQPPPKKESGTTDVAS